MMIAYYRVEDKNEIISRRLTPFMSAGERRVVKGQWKTQSTVRNQAEMLD